MRVCALGVIVLLTISDTLQAQRIPTRGGRLGGRTGGAVPLPPQPPTLRREMRYVQLPLSFEQYPFTSFVSTSSSGLGSSWTSFGMGTRIGLRVSSLFVATLDGTSSLIGGPAQNSTIEAGVRMIRGGWDHRVRPFADLRYGYASSSRYWYGTYDNPFATGPNYFDDVRYTDGFGTVAGGGASFVLGTRWFLTTSLHGMRSHMRPHEFAGSSTTAQPFTVTTYRFALGVTYNPVRSRSAPQTLPQTVTR